jgi:hypothetical protein
MCCESLLPNGRQTAPGFLLLNGFPAATTASLHHWVGLYQPRPTVPASYSPETAFIPARENGPVQRLPLIVKKIIGKGKRSGSFSFQ